MKTIKLALFGVALIIILLVCHSALRTNASTLEIKPELKEAGTVEAKDDGEAGCISFIGPIEIRDPKFAKEHNIDGYVGISVAENTPKSLSVSRGNEASVMMLLHFVSYKEDLTEIKVDSDPINGPGLSIEVCYLGGSIPVNKLITYYPSGTVTVKAVEPLPAKMTIRIPENFPTGIQPIPLGGVGIMTSVPIIDGDRRNGSCVRLCFQSIGA